MAVVTTMAAPPLLNWAYRGLPGPKPADQTVQ
jgi:hypothetical protein